MPNHRETGCLLIPVPEQQLLYLRPPFCSKADLWSVMKDNYALSCLPIPSLHNGWSLVHAGVFVHLSSCQLSLQRASDLAAFAMHSVLLSEDWDPFPAAQCAVLAWADEKMNLCMSIKSPLISCEGVNTSQELLLFCSTLAECRKKWICGVAFIVLEMFENPQEDFMSGTACWTCEVGAKAGFMQGMMAQHSHLYNKLCSLSVLPLAYFQHLHSALLCCSG